MPRVIVEIDKEKYDLLGKYATLIGSTREKTMLEALQDYVEVVIASHMETLSAPPPANVVNIAEYRIAQ